MSDWPITNTDTEIATEDFVRLVLDSTGEGIYGVDLDGNCTFANPACIRLLGFDSVNELLGRHMHDLVHHTRPNGEPYPSEECRIYQAFRQREGVHVDDEVMFRRDGSRFPAEYWSYPVERDGELVGCVLTFVDISERRQVEEELRQTEKMSALGKMSAGLAHELNNPAAAASRAADQLREELDALQSAAFALSRIGLDERQWTAINEWTQRLTQTTEGPPALSTLEMSDREDALTDWLEEHGVADDGMIAATLVGAGVEERHLDAISTEVSDADLANVVPWIYRLISVGDLSRTLGESVKSISELIGIMKSYSGMDQAPIQDVDIHRGIDDTLTLLRHKLNPNIDVVRDYDIDLPPVSARGSELNQVWTNLIDNAIAALGGAGTIRISTHRDEDWIAVDVADDGPGIPADVQSRIFDPFFTTKGVGDGSGLGLDVVRRIVTMRCGGQVTFDSEPGNTVFRVRIPGAQ